LKQGGSCVYAARKPGQRGLPGGGQEREDAVMRP
jgi:hypothetical protein